MFFIFWFLKWSQMLFHELVKHDIRQKSYFLSIWQSWMWNLIKIMIKTLVKSNDIESNSFRWSAQWDETILIQFFGNKTNSRKSTEQNEVFEIFLNAIDRFAFSFSSDKSLKRFFKESNSSLNFKIKSLRLKYPQTTIKWSKKIIMISTRRYVYRDHEIITDKTKLDNQVIHTQYLLCN
jgi:hypothetical protein